MYTLPTFNLTMDIWRDPRTPASGAPDLSGVPVQMYLESRPQIDIEYDDPGFWVPPIILRSPKLSFTPRSGDLYLIVLHGSSYFYLYRWWEYYHAGFPNEYQAVLVIHCDGSRTVPFDQ